MAKPLKCPQCGASEANLLQDNIYQCKFCGSIYELGNTFSVFEKSTTDSKIPNTLDTPATDIARRIARIIFISVAIGIIGIIASVVLTIKKSKFKITGVSTSAQKKIYQTNNESTYFFTAVQTDDGPQIWTVSRINTDGLKEVKYNLNRLDVMENKILQSIPIGQTITWKQSTEDAYRMQQPKTFAKVCFIVYGEQLIGYDIHTFDEIINNEVLRRKFPELKSGIAKVENVYDMHGFKLTTKDGYIFYYSPDKSALLTEKQYDDRNDPELQNSDIVEYILTEGERQQLYKISRKINKEYYTKFPSSSLSRMIKENDDWYKRVYKIKEVKEFISGAIYFNASVLYADAERLVLIYQKELGNEAQLFLSCYDTDAKEIWTRDNVDAAVLKPFLKSTNPESFLSKEQLMIMQPYQIALNLDIRNGNILWWFKPY